MNKKLTYGIFAILFLCYFMAYMGNLSHIIAYHEQHHLFLYTEAYFEQQLQSEGFFYYLTAFIIQFFYYPWLGCTLLALLLALVYLMTSNIICFSFGKQDLFHLGIIPSLLLFYYTMEASHTLVPVTVTVLSLGLVNLILWIFRRRMPLIPILQNTHIQQKKLRMGLQAVVLFVYAGYGYYHFVTSYNRSEGIMLKAEMNVKARDWDNVLKYTKLYLDSGKTNHLIAYFHQLALYHKGLLPHHLFDYPQYLGVKALYFPWNSDSRESEYGHFFTETPVVGNEKLYVYRGDEFAGAFSPYAVWMDESMIPIGQELHAQYYNVEYDTLYTYTCIYAVPEEWMGEAYTLQMLFGGEERYDPVSRAVAWTSDAVIVDLTAYLQGE